ncbi:lipocalin family protein [Muricauda sp. CAU 1633]|uniref:lipocalin family protein n=1 Tax=Allomuricauda sp. CAU 1633 TaxID=2816036 RepID=UPI001A8E1A47|nr:lipocalin family protein [Muricauda sp. CAU 1633]MBO0323150.1 lipocalin family protein [Muricauda sp. CAU 1633]
MIKKIYFSLLAMSLLFVSCDNDENETPPEENNSTTELLGIWNYAAYIDNEGELPATDCEQNQIIDFQENGVFRFTYYDDGSGTCEQNQDATGNWEEVSEGVLELDYGNDDVYEVEYSIAGNTLTLTIDEGEGEYQEVYEK